MWYVNGNSQDSGWCDYLIRKEATITITTTNTSVLVVTVAIFVNNEHYKYYRQVPNLNQLIAAFSYIGAQKPSTSSPEKSVAIS